jgi:hypothetical protein
LTIAAAALVGWWLIGLTPAAAILFGAASAPTAAVAFYGIRGLGTLYYVACG